MTPLTPVQVSKDYGAFSAKGSGFGLKMLEKMGWKKGYGLGAGGVGIVEPIQTKLRPVKMGIGFKGFKEKTDQDRAEEKRRGYAVSSDEDEKSIKSKKKGGKSGKDQEPEPVADGWKKTSARASRKGPKIEYKTAAEIQQDIESADQPMTMAQPQKILDMTGKTVSGWSYMLHVLFCQVSHLQTALLIYQSYSLSSQCRYRSENFHLQARSALQLHGRMNVSQNSAITWNSWPTSLQQIWSSWHENKRQIMFVKRSCRKRALGFSN